ncbi:MAG TPA: hypothetical protein VK044_05245 [Virgibacillus sp.]|nr:hypothetical protein [Virgibacillus sp.]
MEPTKVKKMEREAIEVGDEDVNSLKGTLFASVVFVGGGIIFFIVLLFVIYMTRL